MHNQYSIDPPESISFQVPYIIQRKMINQFTGVHATCELNNYS